MSGASPNRLWIGVALISVTGAAFAFLEVRRARAEARDRMEASLRHASESENAGREKVEILGRLQAAEKREADALARLRTMEKELEGAHATARRAQQDAEVERRRRAQLEKRIEAEAGKAAAPKPEEKPAPPKPKEPPPLSNEAVSDPGQVKKLLDGLNAILALAEEKERWSIASAEAVEGDRLLRVTLEARAPEGGLSRTYEAGEARFVLKAASGTLEIVLREGRVTYPGDRRVDFPEGRYSAVLTVDPAAVRNAGHPLVVDR